MYLLSSGLLRLFPVVLTALLLSPPLVAAVFINTYYLEELCSTNSSYTIGLLCSGVNSTGILKVSRHVPLKGNFSCSVSLRPADPCGTVVAIREVDFPEAGKESGSLTVTNGTATYTPDHNFYDSSESQTTTSTDGVDVVYRSATEGMEQRVGFQLTFTAYSNVSNGRCLKQDGFPCGNGHCIWRQLVCDGHNNCADRSDESKGPPSECVGDITIYFGVGIAGGLALLLIVILTVWYCQERKSSSSTRRGNSLSSIPTTPPSPVGEADEDDVFYTPASSKKKLISNHPSYGSTSLRNLP